MIYAGRLAIPNFLISSCPSPDEISSNEAMGKSSLSTPRILPVSQNPQEESERMVTFTDSSFVSQMASDVPGFLQLSPFPLSTQSVSEEHNAETTGSSISDGWEDAEARSPPSDAMPISVFCSSPLPFINHHPPKIASARMMTTTRPFPAPLPCSEVYVSTTSSLISGFSSLGASKTTARFLLSGDLIG